MDKKTVIDEVPCCAICLDHFGKGKNAQGEDIRPYTIPCAHKFHHSCISKVARASGSCPKCPMCRDRFEINQIRHDSCFENICSLVYRNINGLFCREPSRSLEHFYLEAEPKLQELLVSYQDLIREFKEEITRVSAKNWANGLCLLVDCLSTVLSFTPLALAGVAGCGVSTLSRLAVTVWYLSDNRKRSKRIEEIGRQQRLIKDCRPVRDLCEILKDKEWTSCVSPVYIVEAVSSLINITVLATNIMDALKSGTDFVHGAMNVAVHGSWFMVGGVLCMAGSSYYQWKESQCQVSKCEQTIKILEEEFNTLANGVKVVKHSIEEEAKK